MSESCVRSNAGIICLWSVACLAIIVRCWESKCNDQRRYIIWAWCYIIIAFDVMRKMLWNRMVRIQVRIWAWRYIIVASDVLTKIHCVHSNAGIIYLWSVACLAIIVRCWESKCNDQRRYIIWAWCYIIIAFDVMRKMLWNRMVRIQVRIWAWRYIIVASGVLTKIHCVRSNAGIIYLWSVVCLAITVGCWESKCNEVVGVTSSELGVTS